MFDSRVAVLIFVSFALLGSCKGDPSGSGQSAERALVSRLLDGYDDQIEVGSIPPDDGRDVFELETLGGKLVIRGSNGVAVASGLNQYLKQFGNGHLSWGGDRVDLGETLPPVDRVVQKVSPHSYRYIYNSTVSGYTTPYWDWARWEREIDLIAAHGFNMALVTVGYEKAVIQALTAFGYSEGELREWIAGPGYQPWQWLGNLQGSGPALSEELIEGRATLGRQIVDRMRELGITPVVPGFFGVVPPEFAERNGPDFDVKEQGIWSDSFQRPDLLNPADTDNFSQVASVFYGEIRGVFGEVTHFAADPFHEGGATEDIDVRLGATNIQDAMLLAHPDAVWVLQAWFGNPSTELLAGIQRERAIVLDLWGDELPGFEPYINGGVMPFSGVPWVWSILQNFGGRAGLHGNLELVAGLYDEASGVFFDELRGGLSGLGALMEATHQNPVVLDLLSEMSWREPAEGPIELTEWARGYADRRYGLSIEATRQAWVSLVQTAYSTTPTLQFGTHESILCARPDLNAENVFKASGPRGKPYYDMTRLEEALGDLLSAQDQLRGEDTYEYDLVDVTRQVLANRARFLLDDIRAAYEAENREDFIALSDRFLELILDQDRLVATRPEFLFGSWLRDARSWGSTPDEADRLEGDARRILTLWAEEGGFLQDYAHREWAGLLGDYYHGRWKLYFDYLNDVLGGGDAQPPDFFQYESEWTQRTDTRDYATEAQGDSVAISQELYEKAHTQSKSRLPALDR